jgi:antitoxin component YwqK of YwqJK toxin-antitoxin module
MLSDKRKSVKELRAEVYKARKELFDLYEKEGELHGSYKEFHPPHSGYVNQDIKIDCNYKNGKLHGSYKEYNQYQRINIHKHVDTQGEVIEEEMYENGILLDKGTGE